MPEMRYKEAYALVIDARKLSREEHNTLQEMIQHFNALINDFTPYTSWVDPDYSDDVPPTRWLVFSNRGEPPACTDTNEGSY